MRSRSGKISSQNPQSTDPPSRGNTFLQYISFLLMFVSFSAFALWMLLRLRSNLMQILAALDTSKSIYKGAVNMGTYVIGLLVVVCIVWLQEYLNAGLKRGQLWQRALKVVLGEAILAALSLGTTLLMHFVIFP